MNQIVENWTDFSQKVKEHIETYVQKQYGNSIDTGNDLVTKNGPEYCINAIKRYCDRFGSSARGNVEQERDILKIAHYAQLAYTQYIKKKNNKPVEGLYNIVKELAKKLNVTLMVEHRTSSNNINEFGVFIDPNQVQTYYWIDEYDLADTHTDNLYELNNFLSMKLLELDNK